MGVSQKNAHNCSDIGLSISPSAQVEKPRRCSYRLGFLTCTLEKISCAICISCFSASPYTFSDSIFLALHWLLPYISSGVTCISPYRSVCMTTDTKESAASCIFFDFFYTFLTAPYILHSRHPLFFYSS